MKLFLRCLLVVVSIIVHLFALQPHVSSPVMMLRAVLLGGFFGKTESGMQLLTIMQTKVSWEYPTKAAAGNKLVIFGMEIKKILPI